MTPGAHVWRSDRVNEMDWHGVNKERMSKGPDSDARLATAWLPCASLYYVDDVAYARNASLRGGRECRRLL